MQSEPQDARVLVWAPPRSLAATCGITFVFFSSGYLDVSVHRVPPVKLWIHLTVPEVLSGGFPHSDTRGSMDICSSPRLFAAYHVFLRLSVPRHPPCALLCLTFPTSFVGLSSLRRIAFRLLFLLSFGQPCASFPAHGFGCLYLFGWLTSCLLTSRQPSLF